MLFNRFFSPEAREEHRRAGRRRQLQEGLVVKSAEGVRFTGTAQPLPRSERDLAEEALQDVGGVATVTNVEVNYFTDEEVDSAIENVLHGRPTGETGTVVVGDAVRTIPRAPYTSRDVEVYHSLRNPDALNFMETDDGLKAAPRLP